MLIAINENKEPIFSENAEKKKIYCCPHCDEQLIFKQGKKKIPHFAHQPNSACLFKSEHYNHLYFKFFCKKNLNNILKTNYTIDIEESFTLYNETRIADVVIKELRIALEFQHSNIQPEDWRLRNEFYKHFGLNPIWIFDDEAYGKKQDEGFVKIPTIFIYLRKFYPIYLFNIHYPELIVRLLLGERKQTRVSLTIENEYNGRYWHILDEEWVDEEEGYYRQLKTVFEYTAQNLTWKQLLGGNENE